MEAWSTKIKAALQKELKTTSMLREEWPPHIVRNVFEEMKTATRPDLLSKELWCSASCTSEWWAKSCRFSRSVATMSMIGCVRPTVFFYHLLWRSASHSPLWSLWLSLAHSGSLYLIADACAASSSAALIADADQLP